MHHLKQCLTLEDRLLRQVKPMLERRVGFEKYLTVSFLFLVICTSE